MVCNKFILYVFDEVWKLVMRGKINLTHNSMFRFTVGDYYILNGQNYENGYLKQITLMDFISSTSGKIIRVVKQVNNSLRKSFLKSGKL